MAWAFLADYVRLVYGGSPAVRIRGVAPDLRRRLEHGRALVTPAEHAARARLQRVRLAVAGPPASVVATAAVVAGGRTITLAATLELKRRRWMVVAVGS